MLSLKAAVLPTGGAVSAQLQRRHTTPGLAGSRRGLTLQSAALSCSPSRAGFASGLAPGRCPGGLLRVSAGGGGSSSDLESEGLEQQSFSSLAKAVANKLASEVAGQEGTYNRLKLWYAQGGTGPHCWQAGRVGSASAHQHRKLALLPACWGVLGENPSVDRAAVIPCAGWTRRLGQPSERWRRAPKVRHTRAAGGARSHAALARCSASTCKVACCVAGAEFQPASSSYSLRLPQGNKGVAEEEGNQSKGVQGSSIPPHSPCPP